MSNNKYDCDYCGKEINTTMSEMIVVDWFTALCPECFDKKELKKEGS